MVIAALVCFAVLLIAWIVAPDEHEPAAPRLRLVETEAVAAA